MDEIEEELTKDDVADPQSELIKRQNLEARLSFIVIQKLWITLERQTQKNRCIRIKFATKSI